MKQTPPIAVIYARSATDNPSAILAQITECAERAANNGMLIAGIFHETGPGIKSDRPGLQRMIRFLRSQQRDKLIVLTACPSRISRCIDEYREIQANFDKLNVECWTPFPPQDEAEALKLFTDAFQMASGRKTRRKSKSAVKK